MAEPEEILRQFRSGELSAEAAAELLLPFLQRTGKLELEITDNDMPLLDALQQRAKPRLPPARELVWESEAWLALGGIPDSFWPQIQMHGLDRTPQCLNCLFLVGSSLAADQLIERIESSSSCDGMTDLPADYGRFSGRVFGRTPPLMLSYDALVEWAAWLRSLAPVADAMLDEVYVSGPPTDP